MPTIGVALGSGASRGWSHIGVIKALINAGINPDIICGTSVGAVVGGSYVAGNLEKLEEWVRSANRIDVLRFFDIGLSSGFVDSERLSWFLHAYVAGENQRIETLPKKFAAISTNLNSGREVWFTEGRLSDAVRASMALPGLFPAVRAGEQWLVDGGLVNPVPVSVCRALGAEIVIAANLNSDIVGKRDRPAPKATPSDSKSVMGNIIQQVKAYSNAIFPDQEKEDEVPGLFYAIANSVNIVQNRITRSRLAGDPPEVILSPKLAHIGMLEFHRAAEAIEAGKAAVEEAMDDIRWATDGILR